MECDFPRFIVTPRGIVDTLPAMNTEGWRMVWRNFIRRNALKVMHTK